MAKTTVFNFSRYDGHLDGSDTHFLKATRERIANAWKQWRPDESTGLEIDEDELTYGEFLPPAFYTKFVTVHSPTSGQDGKPYARGGSAERGGQIPLHRAMRMIVDDWKDDPYRQSGATIMWDHQTIRALETMKTIRHQRNFPG